MYLTDDRATDRPPPHYGAMPGTHLRFKKKIFLAHKYAIDGESATEAITTGHSMELKEAFIDSLAMVVCYEGAEGLNNAFREWLREK